MNVKVEGTLPIDGLPHMRRDTCNCGRATEIRRKRATPKDGQENAKRNFDNQGDHQRRQRRPHDPCQVPTGHPWFPALDSHLTPPAAPRVTNESKRSGFQSLDGDHDKPPTNRSEDTPRGSIIRAHGYDAMHKPKIECVPDCRLKARYNAWSEEDLQTTETWNCRALLLGGALRSDTWCVHEIDHSNKGRRHVAGKPD